MKTPPRTLDGARVLFFADLNGLTPSGRTEHYVDDLRVGGFAALAIARYDGANDYYLFYCDDRWSVINDAAFESPWLCVAQAQWEYEEVMFKPVEDLPQGLPQPPTELSFRPMSMNRRVNVPDRATDANLVHRATAESGASSPSANPTLVARIEELTASGRKLEAIAIYRRETGSSLLEAKGAVSNIEQGRPPSAQLPQPQERYWAARVPPDYWRDDDEPSGSLTRWLVLSGTPGTTGWLIYGPDERSGHVWDNWYMTREEAVRFSEECFGVSEEDWVEVAGVRDWPEGPGWPQKGWLP